MLQDVPDAGLGVKHEAIELPEAAPLNIRLVPEAHGPRKRPLPMAGFLKEDKVPSINRTAFDHNQLWPTMATAPKLKTLTDHKHLQTTLPARLCRGTAPSVAIRLRIWWPLPCLGVGTMTLPTWCSTPGSQKQNELPTNLEPNRQATNQPCCSRKGSPDCIGNARATVAPQQQHYQRQQ